VVQKISACDKCGSNKLEQWGESGHWWVHCHNCNFDHEDDTDVDEPEWRGFDDEMLVLYAPEWADLLGDE